MSFLDDVGKHALQQQQLTLESRPSIAAEYTLPKCYTSVLLSDKFNCLAR